LALGVEKAEAKGQNIIQKPNNYIIIRFLSRFAHSEPAFLPRKLKVLILLNYYLFSFVE